MKHEYSARISWTIGIFGILLTLIGVAVPIPSNIQIKDPGLALAIFGSFCALIGLLYPVLWRFMVRIEKPLLTVEQSLLIEVTDSSAKNWNVAIDMCANAPAGSRLLDTTTGKNEIRFEKAVRNVVTSPRDVGYVRIMCFPKSENGELVEGLNSQVEPFFKAQIDYFCDGDTDSDRGKTYEWLREAIIRGRFRLLHLPMSLPIDYFVKDDSLGGHECILGFAEQPLAVSAGLSYSSGIVSKRSDLSRAIKSHFQEVLIPAANRHMRNQLTERNCICADYCLEGHSDTLWPKLKRTNKS